MFVCSRSLSFIEDYIHREVLPEYGNTHTTTSVTSLQTTLYRHEARSEGNAVVQKSCTFILWCGKEIVGSYTKWYQAAHVHTQIFYHVVTTESFNNSHYNCIPDFFRHSQLFHYMYSDRRTEEKLLIEVSALAQMDMIYDVNPLQPLLPVIVMRGHRKKGTEHIFLTGFGGDDLRCLWIFPLELSCHMRKYEFVTVKLVLFASVISCVNFMNPLSLHFKIL